MHPSAGSLQVSIETANVEILMLEHFIETYGYWAVLIGIFFEGKTVLDPFAWRGPAGFMAWDPVNYHIRPVYSNSPP